MLVRRPVAPGFHLLPLSSQPHLQGQISLRLAPTHAFEWQSLGKLFKRKPKSVSHFTPLTPSTSTSPLLALVPFPPLSVSLHTHTAVIWLFKLCAAFPQLELVYDIPSADSWPLVLSLFLKALTNRHEHTQHSTISFFPALFFLLSVLLCLLFLAFPCRRGGCVSYSLVCLEAKKEHTHHVLTVWRGWVEVRERGKEVKGSIS
ncbi:hypothetical protein AMECASPLE_013220 [Ameca splendens]|uniref:Uncharacterized protein n=1 Tax=Ameca splendens TaxID=208324 RepID=A0ABV0ZLJ9_9TELE